MDKSLILEFLNANYITFQLKKLNTSEPWSRKSVWMMSSFTPCKPLPNWGQTCQAQQHPGNDWPTRAGTTSRIWNISHIEAKKKSSSEIVHTTISILFLRGRRKKHIFAILASPQDLYTLSLFSGGDPLNLPLFFLHINKRPLLNSRFECLSIEFLLGIKTVTRSMAGCLGWKPGKNNALASNPLNVYHLLPRKSIKCHK